MALPEDEAKQTPESGEETFENEALKQEAPEQEVLEQEALEQEASEQIEADNGDGPSGQQGSDNELELLGDEALAIALLEVEKFRDLALRAEAEMQNLQRRTARDVENAHKFGVEKFVQNMLPVVDSLEKAIESTGDNADAIAQGVRLCHKLMVDTLNKEGVEIIDPVGEPFDPNEHQAMSMVENPDMEPNSVLAVVQKGCKLNGRLVRPAMVMVTRAPADQPPVDPAPETTE
ncbi:MAG: nucleotide exchange factor GrpE [Pseudomonadales bacterium]|nr:nucleotide exchange factor GrpE [Pseudomonadales bacterium]